MLQYRLGARRVSTVSFVLLSARFQLHGAEPSISEVVDQHSAPETGHTADYFDLLGDRAIQTDLDIQQTLYHLDSSSFPSFIDVYQDRSAAAGRDRPEGGLPRI
jgi:hypothetical protein